MKWTMDPADAHLLAQLEEDRPICPHFHSYALENLEWDQFEVNEKLTGKKTDYREEEYTTQLDRTSPMFKERMRKADRLARDIESV